MATEEIDIDAKAFFKRTSSILAQFKVSRLRAPSLSLSLLLKPSATFCSKLAVKKMRGSVAVMPFLS
jgi:hypothetical protein